MLDIATRSQPDAATTVARPSRLARTLYSLRVRLIALVLLALVPAFALILYNAWQDRQDARDRVREDAVTLTQLSVIQQQQLIEGSRQLLVTLSPLASSADLTTIDRTTCGPALATFLQDLTFYANLGITGPDGSVVCSASSSDVGLSIAGRSSFQAASLTKAFAVGRYVDDPITGKNILDTTTPIFAQDGSVKGMVFLDVDLGWLNDQVAQAELPSGAVFTIFDGTGTIVARQPEDGLTGRVFPNASLVANVIADGEGTTETSGVDGTNRLYSFTHITQPDPTDLYAVVGVPTRTAYASVNSDLQRNLGALGVVALLALAAAWFGSDVFLIRQAKGLVAATNRVSQGDLKARTGLSGTSSEIGTLARAFDDMAERLEQRSAEQRAAQEELRRVNESLEQRVEERTREVAENAKELRLSNSELEDFTYVVSHDLKEPLRGIEAFSGFLAQDYGDRLDEEGRRYLAIVRDSAVRMKDLIEDLLELSKVGRQQVELKPVELARLIPEVAEDLRYAIDEKHVELQVAPDFPRVMCDRVRIKEVFKNLISNAIKFNDKPNPRVHVSWGKEKDAYRFTVGDNGIGIDPEYYDRVFQIFQRLGRREDYPGTGAGLTICKKIVEMHGGAIGVESAPGQGSTFWFTIEAQPQSEGVTYDRQPATR